MKRYLSLFLAVLITFGCFTTVAAGEPEQKHTPAQFTYTINEGCVTIKSVLNNDDTEVVIPDTVEDLPVTAIDDFSFESSDAVSVKIPASVDSIGINAFINTPLEKITVDADNESYASSDGILYNKDETVLIKCPEKRTQAVTLPETVLVIGENAFMNSCAVSVILSDSLSSVNKQAFACSAIESIVLGDCVTFVDEAAFLNCVNLKTAVLSNSLETIPYALFSGCTSLSAIEIPSGVTSVGALAFYNTSLEKVYLGNKVTSVGEKSFGYKMLDDVEFVKLEQFEIWGEKETAAQTYADDNGFKFVNTKLDTPVLVEAYADNTCITFNWCKADGADSYYVYRKTNGGKWKKIAVTGDDETVYCDFDIKTGNVYTYTARAVVGGYTGKYDTAGVSAEYIKLPVPTLVSAEFEKDGITVKWKKVSSAESYILYRKTKNTDWVEIKEFDSSVVSYKDKTVKSGNTYYYTLKCCRGDIISNYNTKGVNAYYISVPKNLSASNTSKGITVKWSKVTGADSYIIGRKTANTGWTKIAEVGDVSSYTDKTAKASVTYTYTVVSCKGEIKGFYDEKGVSYRFISTPKLSAISNVTSGVKVEWTKVSGASGYKVYKKTSDGFKIIATVKGKDSLSYIDEDVKSGTSYTYTVRAYYSKYVSSCSSKGLTILCIDAPKISSATAVKSGITVKWNKISAAKGYYIYRKNSDGSFTKIATVKSNSTLSYTDKNAVKGASNTYAVKAYSGKTVSGMYKTNKKAVCKY